MKQACATAIAVFGAAFCAWGQEAGAGIDLHATITAQAAASSELSDAPRNGAAVVPGFRAMLYPTIKLDEHWSLTGVIEAISRPFDSEDFSSIGYGVRGRVLQGTLGYSRVSKKGSVVIRAGEMLSAFGSFLLRYDDADNPLVDMPPGYGYYYDPVATLGLAGVEADVSRGKWDGRLQLTNSSPANPRSIFQKDQYGNWAGGAGYTIRQGLRVGFSGYRGPYLDRQYPYYFPGEAPPNELPASGVGVDAAWAVGHWNLTGEWQRFVMAYKVIPTFHQDYGYVEVKRVLHPRWFLAARAGYVDTDYSTEQIWEGTLGYRPNNHQIVKAGYTVLRADGSGKLDKVFVVQVVTTIHPLSLAWN